MARVRYLGKDDLAEEYHDLLQRDINLAKLYAHSPEAGRHMARVGNWIRYKCGLDPRLRELAILQIGYLSRTPYEYSHHIKIGRDFGVSDDDIRAIALETASENSGIDELAALVLRAAREMTSGLEMKDDTFEALQLELGDAGIVDLTIVISFYNSVIRFLANLRIDVEDDYLPFLKEFPLPD